ncbi:GDSL esterase/lipase At5g03610-like isoform X2 [Olea europaea var. sylvestris]|uniref:GDSL esterase/lipase At5g03610-like isoform X2 n=1 Tax=Olea europaea var. sylvestris TaxID=158386 RepID=UPI000C1D1B60|nr:GDSL esterase/lipase At5g03610-like isoform X2 [Olea europaea var. sylvestris]
MEFLILFFHCFLLTTGVQGSSPHHHHFHEHNLHENHQRYSFRPTKLFVFGDSYADTGNVKKSLANSWKEPYGSTFPGKPAGRFSDGRILTDYLATFLGLKSPVAYKWRNLRKQKWNYGMNFAYGGSGVFNTFGDLLPNISTQIDFFEKLINDSVYTKWDLQSSAVLVSLAGNDYAAYLANGGSFQGLTSFMSKVIDQLAVNLKRVHGLGARKIVVTSLQPLGCLPRSTRMLSFQKCNETENIAVNYHNLLLQQAVVKLNNETRNCAIFIVDLYSSFTSVIQHKRDYLGNMKFKTPLKPCCMGKNDGYLCGSVDDKGAKMYTVCNDPTSAYFWDNAHPTQAGWHAVFATLKSSFDHIFKY